MATTAPIAAALLGATFLISGAAKVSSGPAWPLQAKMLGRLAVLAAPALPWVEVVLGALLCAQIARVPLAIAGAVLLCAFTVLLCSLLARGQHPPCACFGSWSAKPVGWRHVVRNAALVGLAAVAILT